jgi:hypothetical protein
MVYNVIWLYTAVCVCEGPEARTKVMCSLNSAQFTSTSD